MAQESFRTLLEPEDVALIPLTPRDLGFTAPVSISEIFDSKHLKEWSAANLNGFEIELCPAEVGPHLLLQYPDQPRGQHL